MELLNRTKARLPGKWYTSVLGDIPSLLRCVDPMSLPAELLGDGGRIFDDAFSGTIVRVQFAPSHINTPVVMDGSHQAYIFSKGKYRELFTAVEAALRDESNEELFGGQKYGSCIASSANLSGEPSITERTAAVEFARQRGIRVLLTDRSLVARPVELMGSHPIFALTRQEVRVVRKGHLIEEVAKKLPPHLQPILSPPPATATG